jgi:hypothetical protein
MTHQDAYEALVRRSTASVGMSDDPNIAAVFVQAVPREQAAKILLGLLPEGEETATLDGIGRMTDAALHFLACGLNGEQQAGTLYGVLAQAVALGLLLGRDEP